MFAQEMIRTIYQLISSFLTLISFHRHLGLHSYHISLIYLLEVQNEPFNPLKRSSVRRLHLKVFSAIQV